MSSLSMSDLINTLVDTINIMKSAKFDEVNTGDSSGVKKIYNVYLYAMENIYLKVSWTESGELL